MCGIAGLVACAMNRVSSTAFNHARSKLEHRGPDGGGTWVNQTRSAGLVHTRLAVVDVAGGKQPLSNERANVHVVCNGEIYNHIELRAELERQGHRFRTRCDAEVLVHLYEEFGLDLFSHLNGMFAFALWDEDQELLVLARDRLGQKPLYYQAQESALTFASELKALQPLLESPLRVRPSAIDEFLTFTYVPHENGVFEGIQQLAPGHYLTWCRGTCRLASYWSYPAPRPEFDGGIDDAAKALRELLHDATRLRLRSDVPVGVLLSGGIDSAAVVGLIAEAGVTPIRTFTASFAGPGADERPYARAIARRFGTEHHELRIAAPTRELMYHVLDHFDEPFADTSAIPTYLISQQARRHVKVVLTGDGGDESFLGYTRYALYRRYLNQRRWAFPLTRLTGLGAVGRWLCPRPLQRTVRRRLRTLTNFWNPGPREVYERWYAAFPRRLKSQLGRKEFVDLLDRSANTGHWMAATLDAFAGVDPVAGAAAFDLRHYLPDAVLTKVDRMSMAHGLECRSPLLDHRIIEFAARLPVNWRLHPRHGSKWIFRLACRDLLPNEVFERPKTGFGAPVGDWLRDDLSGKLAHECLPARGLEQWLDPSVVTRMIADHHRHVEDHTYRLWTLLALNRFWSKHGAQRA